MTIESVISDLEFIRSKFSIEENYYFVIDTDTNDLIYICPNAYILHRVDISLNIIENIISLLHPDDLEFMNYAENWGFDKIVDFNEKNTYKLGYFIRMKIDTNNYEVFYNQTYYEFIDKNTFKHCIHNITKFKNIHFKLDYICSIINVNNNDIEESIYYNVISEKNKKLTKREIEILNLIIEGFTDKKISKYLNVSYHTIRTHHSNINRKLNVKNPAELINKCKEIGFLI